MYPKVVPFLFAALALAARGDSATRTIEPERWTPTIADGQLLPALVVHRQEGRVPERTFVDFVMQ